MKPSSGIAFNNSYIKLPERFFSRQLPTPVAAPLMIRANYALARELGIDPAWLDTPEALQVLAGNEILPAAAPIATVYAGHQFGHWNPQLGDGRAVLLGEVIGNDGQRYDIQLKGAGETPYSRRGDGRSPLGPVLREYIVSEAMAALGVPTTRSLAAISSGEKVVRDALLPGGILTRVASSHIRIGTFQFFAARGDNDAVRALADHVIARHFPTLASSEQPYLALLEAVIARQAALVAQWQQLGFIHGVMNTDNMLISGETIDYGPCAFMDDHHPDKVFSSIDQGARYAYGNQPSIAQWNLVWFAQALLPLLSDSEAKAVALAETALDTFPATYQPHYETGMLAKLGIHEHNDANVALLNRLLTLMSDTAADHSLTFRRLSERVNPALENDASIAGIYELPESFTSWITQWQTQLAREPLPAAERQHQMFAVNPVFIPRNHLVEEVIQAANQGQFQPFHDLVERLADPYHYAAIHEHYAKPPRPEQVVCKTFCGT